MSLADKARLAVKATALAIKELPAETECQRHPQMFDGPGKDEYLRDVVYRVKQARQHCFACPVRSTCLEQGHADEKAFGILGGELFGAWFDPMVIVANKELTKENAA